MNTVNLKRVEIALEHVNGSDFEKFFHAFYPALAGIDFVPLGGVHDGGADAFQGEGLFETAGGRSDTFYQATIQKDHRAKIRSTVRRLRKFGREPISVQYFGDYIAKLRTLPLASGFEPEEPLPELVFAEPRHVEFLL